MNLGKLPDASLQNHVRPLGHGPDDVHQIPRGGGRRRGCTHDVLFRLCTNADPQRDSIFTKGPSDVLDHATSEIEIGTKLGMDATRKLPGEGFKEALASVNPMNDEVRRKIDALFGATNG